MSAPGPLASGLYPIVRRVRRPLIEPDVPPIPANIIPDGRQSVPVVSALKKPKPDHADDPTSTGAP